MKHGLTRKAITAFLIYVLVVCITALGAYAAGIVFRQYLRITNECVLIVGLFAVLLIWNKEIPKEQKNNRTKARMITAVVILLNLIGLFLRILTGIDKEMVKQEGGETKIEVERSWILFLERSYYDYKNIFWYTKNPHYTEHYDDGRQDQLIYTDYYNENGDFTDRVYPDGS